MKIDNIGVCNTNWNIDYSHLVCKEMGCSNAVVSSNKTVPSLDTEYHHVQCEKYHSKLGQCRRFKAKCDSGLVSVHCVKNVKINTEEKCGGKIQVHYRNQWENVCVVTPLSPKLKDQLCEKLECDGWKSSTHIPNSQPVETTLNCTDTHEDITYCISQGSCEGLEPAEVICPGYKIKIPTKTVVASLNLWPLIVGIGFLVLFVILVIIVFGICIVPRIKSGTTAKTRSLSQTEAEYEICNYEDLRRKTCETGNFSLQGSRPEAEVIMESDARSTSSFPYDDIDDAPGETRRLTSQAIKGSFSGDSFIPKGAVDQSRGGVTYEVEDFGESYDDIDKVLPEASQAKADVHSSPGTSPESFPAPPPGLLEGDAEGGKDYLVPGQDW